MNLLMKEFALGKVKNLTESIGLYIDRSFAFGVELLKGKIRMKNEYESPTMEVYRMNDKGILRTSKDNPLPENDEFWTPNF